MDSEWNESAYLAVHRKSLNPEFQTELACQDAELSLDAEMPGAIRLSMRLDISKESSSTCQLQNSSHPH